MGNTHDANKELTSDKPTPSAPFGSRASRIETLLRQAFAPSALEILDESAAHAGHAGARPGGETHYRVRITAAALSSLPRVQRHRAVMRALAPEFDSGLHALALEAD